MVGWVGDQKNQKKSKFWNRLKTKKTDISRIPESPVTTQNTQKPNFWQKPEFFKIFKNWILDQKLSLVEVDEPLPYMVGWVGYWHPQAQRHSCTPKFSDRPKNQKKSKFWDRPKTKKTDISRLPECPMTPQNTQNSIFWQKSEIFKIVKNRIFEQDLSLGPVFEDFWPGGMRVAIE